jgi:hypothetical protein
MTRVGRHLLIYAALLLTLPLRETLIVACIQAPSFSWRGFWVLTPGAHTEYNRDTDRSC